MILLYLTLCYFIHIPKTAGHVIMAANIDDFRALVERFMPETMADDILALDANVNLRAKGGHNSNQFYDKTNENQSVNKAYFEAKKGINKIKHEINLDDIVEEVKERLRKELTSMASNINKRKKKKSNNISLQEEHFIAKSPMRNKIALTDPKVDMKINPVMNLQARYLKQSRNDEENESYQTKKNRIEKHFKSSTPDDRYVAELFVAPPSRYLPKEKKLNSLRPKHLLKQSKVQSKLKQQNNSPMYFSDEENKEKTLNREPISGNKHIQRQKYKIRPAKRKKHLIAGEKGHDKRKPIQEVKMNSENNAWFDKPNQADNLFERIDMTYKNDSYEDYEIPKKDYSSVEKIRPKFSDLWIPSTIKHKEKLNLILKDFDTSKYKGKIKAKSVNNIKKKMSIFVAHGDRAVKNNPDNKKRHFMQKQSMDKHSKLKQHHNKNFKAPLVTESVQDSEYTIEPYAHQLRKDTTANDEDNDKTQETVTEELKARTESIRFEEENYSKVLHNKPIINKPTNRKNRQYHMPKGGAIIPKRDFYKFSSPNYLAKLPIIAEKYKFDEPIPEQDRDPEVLKTVGNPPASINGKVLLT